MFIGSHLEIYKKNLKVFWSLNICDFLSNAHNLTEQKVYFG